MKGSTDGQRRMHKDKKGPASTSGPAARANAVGQGRQTDPERIQERDAGALPGPVRWRSELRRHQRAPPAYGAATRSRSRTARGPRSRSPSPPAEPPPGESGPGERATSVRQTGQAVERAAKSTGQAVGQAASKAKGPASQVAPP